MLIDFRGSIFQWPGPARFDYAAVPSQPRANIRTVAPVVTYAWGVIPVWAT